MNNDLRRESGIVESLFPERFNSDTWTRPENDSGTDPERPHCSKLSTGYMYLLLCTLPWYMYTDDTQKKPGKRRKLQSAGMKDE